MESCRCLCIWGLQAFCKILDERCHRRIRQEFGERCCRLGIDCAGSAFCARLIIVLDFRLRTFVLIEEVIEALGVDSPVIVQDMCILLCDHGCLRMTGVTLNGFDIAAVQLEFVCNTGMSEAMENHFREIVLLDQAIQGCIDGGMHCWKTQRAGNHQIVVGVLVAQSLLDVVLVSLVGDQHFSNRSGQKHRSDAALGFGLLQNLVRIRECKAMIAALHAAGIGVVMDVVYNHMYRNENPLNDTVPCYFFRQNEDGSFSNGSGCGNEFASERPMARRYMIDSILYWAQEYHIDGFRFDLMGLYDVETINAVRAALDALPGGRDILMYGEPWQGGGSQLHRYEANKANLSMLNERIGIFCDDTRDTIKGGCFSAREPGYVEGRLGSFWDIGGAVAAWCRSDRLPPHAPSQIVNYVSAHDNFTLWDKLLLVRYEKPEFTAADGTALAQNRLAAGIYLTSFGLPFLQAGEEFARTKKGKGNSYRSSPALNRLDWERAEKYHALVDYYRGLLALRARFPRLSSTDPHAPDALYFFSLEQPLVGWQLPAQWGDGAAWQALCVFYNPTEISKVVPLPVGRWQMLSDGISSSLWRGPARVYEHEAVLMPYSATIFGQI